MDEKWQKHERGKPEFVRIIERSVDLLKKEKERLEEVRNKMIKLSMQNERDRQHRMAKRYGGMEGN